MTTPCTPTTEKSPPQVCIKRTQIEFLPDDAHTIDARVESNKMWKNQTYQLEPRVLEEAQTRIHHTFQYQLRKMAGSGSSVDPITGKCARVYTVHHTGSNTLDRKIMKRHITRNHTDLNSKEYLVLSNSLTRCTSKR